MISLSRLNPLSRTIVIRACVNCAGEGKAPALPSPAQLTHARIMIVRERGFSLDRLGYDVME